MIGTIRLDKISKFEASYTTFEICHLLGGNVLTENFDVIALKCRSDDKHHKTMCNQGIRSV